MMMSGVRGSKVLALFLAEGPLHTAVIECRKQCKEVAVPNCHPNLLRYESCTFLRSGRTLLSIPISRVDTFRRGQHIILSPGKNKCVDGLSSQIYCTHVRSLAPNEAITGVISHLHGTSTVYHIIESSRPQLQTENAIAKEMRDDIDCRRILLCNCVNGVDWHTLGKSRKEGSGFLPLPTNAATKIDQ